MSITMYHLYPDLLNQNGDRGNIMALTQRCRWRGISVQVQDVKAGYSLDLASCDLLFIGGGTPQGQALALKELIPWGDMLQEMLELGIVMLAIGEGLQLLGRYNSFDANQHSQGLKILPIHTEFKGKRIVGPAAVEVALEDKQTVLVGFENHSGKTYLNGIHPLGLVKHGGGNNGQDGTEGVKYKNLFGTYLQGPLLPANPMLTDHLIGLALRRKNKDITLTPLDDTLEQQAHQGIMQQLNHG